MTRTPTTRVYVYKALDACGRVVRGFARAASSEELAALLLEQHLTLIRCHPTFKLPWRLDVDGAWFFGRLGHLLSQKISLCDSLFILQNTVQGRSQFFLQTVLELIQRGTSFADSLTKSGISFPPFVCSCLHHAEASGTLASTCVLLQKFFETQTALRDQHRKSLAYPLFLLLVIFGVLTALLHLLVPQLKDLILEFSNKKTPGLGGSFLFFISDFAINHPWLYSTGALFIGGIILITLRFILNGTAFGICHCQDPSTLLWMETFSLLIQSSIPLSQALALSTQHINSKKLDLSQLVQAIHSGQSLHQALRQVSSLPASFIKFAELGEKSGSLGLLLQQGSDFALKECFESSKRRNALTAPTLLILAGVFLLWIVMTLFAPFYKMSFPV